MKPFVDIHSHILPGVDDGSGDFGTSLEMLRMAREEGIGGVILTPHFKPMRHNAGPEEIRSLGERLQREVLEDGMRIRLYSGNEFYYHREMFRELEERRACTLAGSDYILIEFSPMTDLATVRNGLYEALAEGYRPILAHVERYRNVCAKLGYIEELIEMGCYIQVNAGSIMGQFGRTAQDVTRRLLKAGAVHFVATDAHDTRSRAPRLSECAAYIAKRYGMDYMQELLCENPRHILKNEYI